MGRNTQINPIEVTDADLASIDEALMDLEIEAIADEENAVVDMTEEEIIAQDHDVITELELGGEDEQMLEAAVEQAQAYEIQEIGSDVTENVPTPATAKAKRASKVVRATATPRVSRDVQSLDETAFILTSDTPADLAANKADVIASRPAQVKIADKFDNVLTSLAAGRKPSTYVMDCFRALSAKNEITSAELVSVLRSTKKKDGSSCYTEGTARSQAGQIMSLFNTLKIAHRSGQTLKLNPDSTLGAALKALV